MVCVKINNDELFCNAFPLHTSADPSGNGYTPNKLPLDTQGGTWGVLGVKHSNVCGSCQTAGPIGTNFGSRLWIHLGMDNG